MEIFYSPDIAQGGTRLDATESGHCIKVLRHRKGDTINIVDGAGTLFKCEITDDNPRCVVFTVLERQEGYGSHPYRLHIAVAPPKNTERFDWFVEKATEMGIDEISPIFGDYSERRIFKRERSERIIIAAAKQSHKGAIPVLHDPVTVREFLEHMSCAESGKVFSCSDTEKVIPRLHTEKQLSESTPLRLICYCDEVESLGAMKISITEALRKGSSDVIVMIGPEGDFSREEIAQAVTLGWQPVSLGNSRLRIETAALTAVAAVYLADRKSVV